MPAIFRRFLKRAPRTAIEMDLDDAAPCVVVIQASETRAAWDKAVVLSVARTIEPDVDRVMHWFTSDPIRELGGRTAQELVEEGVTARLLDMLVTIRSGHREQ